MVQARFAKLRVSSAYQLVAQTLEDEILAGRMTLGEQLPAEVDLAAQFGVNRSTLREGIRLLEHSGLVQRDSTRRLRVTLPKSTELSSRVRRDLILHEITFRELWELAMCLEPAAAALAAQRIDEEAIAALADNVRKTEEALGRGEVRFIVPLDMEFHDLIAKSAGNRALILAREPASMLLYPAFETLQPHLPQSGPRLLAAHKRILDALQGHDSATAEQWMRKHIVDFRRGYEVAALDVEAPVDGRPREGVEE